MRAVLLVYDLPVQNHIPNPSWHLKRLGVRCNLSAWIIPEERVPWALLERLRALGAAWHVVRFDEGEADKLRAMAREALQREAGRIKDSLTKSVARAQEQLAQAESEGGLFTEEMREEALARRDRYTKTILRVARKNLGAAEEAAIAFDLLADVEELICGVRDAVAAETDAYVSWRRGSGLDEVKQTVTA